MAPFVDDIVADLSELVRGSVKSVEDMISEDTDAVLLRRLKRHYATLSLEEVVAIRDLLGHGDGENTPCPTCRFMARSEVEMLED